MGDDKFQNKYRISSARLQTWDYASNGAYFITICTKNRVHYFGKIENEKMILSNVGVITDLLWYEIKNHAKNVELGQFVVMPNHLHGILILNNNDNGGNIGNVGKKRFQNQGKNSLSSIVGSYKSAITKHCNRLEFEFDWQYRFHDHIIRNTQSFQKIQNYIANNPKNWKNDKFYGNE
ncbi:MAG: hypothetical protein RBR97_02745 [Bacteroidales bacterium]|jgi:REP element-mobilizing transposase RayT|nr:hypothetical protein [Bacteroidales bacterium]